MFESNSIWKIFNKLLLNVDISGDSRQHGYHLNLWLALMAFLFKLLIRRILIHWLPSHLLLNIFALINGERLGIVVQLVSIQIDNLLFSFLMGNFLTIFNLFGLIMIMISILHNCRRQSALKRRRVCSKPLHLLILNFGPVDDKRRWRLVQLAAPVKVRVAQLGQLDRPQFLDAAAGSEEVGRLLLILLLLLLLSLEVFFGGQLGPLGQGRVASKFTLGLLVWRHLIEKLWIEVHF